MKMLSFCTYTCCKISKKEKIPINKAWVQRGVGYIVLLLHFCFKGKCCSSYPTLVLL